MNPDVDIGKWTAAVMDAAAAVEDQAAYPVIVVTASTTDVDFTIQPVEPECRVVDGHPLAVAHGVTTGV